MLPKFGILENNFIFYCISLTIVAFSACVYLFVYLSIYLSQGIASFVVLHAMWL